MKMIKTRTELLTYLDSIGYDKPNYQIAVEALIFTPQGKLILQKRGEQARDEVGKLEGVGGRVHQSETDLHQKLLKEISEELGENLKVNIERLLEVRQVQFKEHGTGKMRDWIVVSHLCQLISGSPVIGEPHKTESLHYLTLDELYAKNELELSNSTIAARITYQQKYGNRPYYDVPENDE